MAMKTDKQAKLAQPETPAPTGPMYGEVGTPGILGYGGYIEKAYHQDLYWPGVYELYNRLRRSDRACVVVGAAMGATGSQLRVSTELPEQPSEDDKRYSEFQDSVLGDMEGTISKWVSESIAYGPFMGWGAWEIVPGKRSSDWIPPDGDTWRSQYNDGLIGLRRLGFRDHSTFFSWDMDDKGRVLGMWQKDMSKPEVLIPSERMVHLRFGDLNNPEGLTPLEALWRLERISYGLEVVQGIGFERSAGYLNVEKTEAGALSATDKANVRAAAKAVLSAQESNYLLLPYGFKAQIMDVPFSSGPAILEAIKFYDTLKFALFGMSFLAMSTLSGTGSYSARSDASLMWLQGFNSMMAGFTAQLDDQLGKRLWEWNKAAFPGVTKRPKLTITSAEKSVDLPELASFMSAMQSVMPLGEDDFIEVRRRSGFLPETLPTNAAPIPATGTPAGGTAATAISTTPQAVDPAQAAATAAVQDVALNGAQVTAALEVVGQVAQGTLTYEQGLNALQIMFGMSEEQARRLLGDPGAIKPPAPEVPAPSPAALAAAWQAARVRFSRIAELSQGGPRMVELARDYETIKAQYGEKVYESVLGYLASERPSTKFKNDVKKAMVAAFPEAFYLAYANGKGAEVDKEDDAWLTARINQEVANIDTLFASMKDKRAGATEIDKTELIDEANSRADGYMRGLAGVYAEGLLRGAKNVMLTMVGEDGADNCKDCKKLKGKRYSARKWLRIGIPGVPYNGYECGGHRCQHGLITDDGEKWLPTQ